MLFFPSCRCWRQLCCPGVSKSSAFFFSLKRIQIGILANKCFPRRISSSRKCPHPIWPLVLDHIGVTTFRASTTWCRLNWVQGLWVGFLQTNFIVSDFKNSEGEKGSCIHEIGNRHTKAFPHLDPMICSCPAHCCQGHTDVLTRFKPICHSSNCNTTVP